MFGKGNYFYDPVFNHLRNIFRGNLMARRLQDTSNLKKWKRVPTASSTLRGSVVSSAWTQRVSFVM